MNFSLLIIVFTIALFHIHASEAVTYTEIENDLPGDSVLIVNCLSRDEDLGNKTVNISRFGIPVVGRWRVHGNSAILLQVVVGIEDGAFRDAFGVGFGLS